MTLKIKKTMIAQFIEMKLNKIDVVQFFCLIIIKKQDAYGWSSNILQFS